MAEFDLGSQSVFSHQIHPQEPSEADGKNPNQLSATGTVGVETRKRRGRPLGAKNKPKPPVFITHESPNTIRVHLLEVQSGCDVFGSLVAYAHKHQQGLCVLSATGRVSGVILHDTTEAGVLPLHGEFEIVSLSGTFLPLPIQAGQNSLTVILTLGGARVMGGAVVGPLIAYGSVTVVMAPFSDVVCETLPLEIFNEQQYVNEPPFSGDGVGGPVFPLLDKHVDQWPGSFLT